MPKITTQPQAAERMSREQAMLMQTEQTKDIDKNLKNIAKKIEDNFYKNKLVNIESVIIVLDFLSSMHEFNRLLAKTLDDFKQHLSEEKVEAVLFTILTRDKTRPEYKELFTYLASIYQEGILDRINLAIVGGLSEALLGPTLRAIDTYILSIISDISIVSSGIFQQLKASADDKNKEVDKKIFDDFVDSTLALLESIFATAKQCSEHKANLATSVAKILKARSKKAKAAKAAKKKKAEAKKKKAAEAKGEGEGEVQEEYEADEEVKTVMQEIEEYTEGGFADLTRWMISAFSKFTSMSKESSNPFAKIAGSIGKSAVHSLVHSNFSKFFKGNNYDEDKVKKSLLAWYKKNLVYLQAAIENDRIIQEAIKAEKEIIETKQEIIESDKGITEAQKKELAQNNLDRLKAKTIGLTTLSGIYRHIFNVNVFFEWCIQSKGYLNTLINTLGISVNGMGCLRRTFDNMSDILKDIIHLQSELIDEIEKGKEKGVVSLVGEGSLGAKIPYKERPAILTSPVGFDKTSTPLGFTFEKKVIELLKNFLELLNFDEFGKDIKEMLFLYQNACGDSGKAGEELIIKDLSLFTAKILFYIFNCKELSIKDIMNGKKYNGKLTVNMIDKFLDSMKQLLTVYHSNQTLSVYQWESFGHLQDISDEVKDLFCCALSLEKADIIEGVINIDLSIQERKTGRLYDTMAIVNYDELMKEFDKLKKMIQDNGDWIRFARRDEYIEYIKKSNEESYMGNNALDTGEISLNSEAKKKIKIANEFLDEVDKDEGLDLQIYAKYVPLKLSKADTSPQIQEIFQLLKSNFDPEISIPGEVSTAGDCEVSTAGDCKVSTAGDCEVSTAGDCKYHADLDPRKQGLAKHKDTEIPNHETPNHSLQLNINPYKAKPENTASTILSSSRSSSGSSLSSNPRSQISLTKSRSASNRGLAKSKLSGSTLSLSGSSNNGLLESKAISHFKMNQSHISK